MRAMTTETERAIERATQLTEELSRVLSSLKSTGAAEGPRILDPSAIERLADGLGDRDEAVLLATSFCNGLTARVATYFDAAESGDDARARRLLIDLRSSSQLMGAAAIAAWCRRREAGDATRDAELVDLVERTRREVTVWRLSTVAELDVR